MYAKNLMTFAARVARLKAEGLTTRAVSERLGVPVSTLNDRLRRARAERERLRESFAALLLGG